MEQLKHECGIAMIRLLKPLEYYQEKYGTWMFGLNKLYLLMEKQHNRGQEGAGLACVKMDVTVYCDYQDFLDRNPGAKIYMATTKGLHVYSDVEYEPDCFLMFGKESAGIPEDILLENQEQCVRIPMWGDIRSLNLSNSVSIVLYEALRQNGFEKMTMQGQLHHLHWKE